MFTKFWEFFCLLWKEHIFWIFEKESNPTLAKYAYETYPIE